MRYAFSNCVYSWGLGDDFRNGIQRTEYSTGSRINDCSSLILILTGVVFLFLANIRDHRDWMVLSPFLPLLHALSSLPIWPPLTYSRFWAKWHRKGMKDKQEPIQVSLLFVCVEVFSPCGS